MNVTDSNILVKVYLLMLMDRATLPYAKLTVLRCILSIITRQWATVIYHPFGKTWY